MSKLKELFSPRDMTVGAPYKRIAEFAVPMLIGNIAQQLYNTADSIVVGIYVGDNALAAVGSAAPILNLLLALFVGISTGAGILVSQSFGAKDREKLSGTIGTCITLMLIASVIIAVLGVLLSRPLLLLLDTPASLINWCADYLIILFVGGFGSFFYNIFSGILRGLGDSFSALGFLLVAAALNVVLDIWFVASFGMGVAGVALATILAQTISALLCFIKLLKMRDVFDMSRKLLKPNMGLTREVFRLGIPSGITQAIFSMAMLVVQSLTNSFGEMVIACNVIVMRVDGFAMMPAFSAGMAMTTFSAQNAGARRIDRIRIGTKQGTMMSLGVSVVMTSLILLFGPYLMAVFTDTAELIDLSARMMGILAVGYLAMSISQSLSGVMRGAGDTMTPMWISLLTTVVIRVPIAYTIAWFTRSPEYPTGRPESTFISLLVSWTIGAFITFLAYRFGKWRRQLMAAMETETTVLPVKPALE